MPWYWVLLMVIASQGIFLLIFWLITKGKSHSFNKEIGASSEQRLKDELEAERKKSETVSEAYTQLSERYKKISTWYNENKDRIDDEASKAFKNLAGDPEAIDDWLDSLLTPNS